MLKHFTDEGSFVHKYARRKNHHVFWARILGVAIVLFPLSLHHVDFRATFSLGLSVSAHKASPAYAALEDLRENYTVEVPSVPERVQQIAAGESFNVKTSHTPMSVRQVAMRGMTIHAPVSLQPKPFYVAGEVRTYATRKQQLVQEMKQEDWSIPTVSALAQELTEREMLIPPQRDERVIRSRTGNPIIIRANHEPAPPPRQVSMNTTPPAKPPADVPVPDDKAPNVASPFGMMSLHNPSPDDLRPLWLMGQVEMTGGLAFVGPETQMVLKRVFNGQVLETGRIWVTEGRFEIRVKQPTGFLVAELHTSDGRILGRGEINLLDLGILPAKEDKVANLRIALRPTASGASFHAISGYSHGNQKIPIADARVEIQAYSDPQKTNEDGIVTEPTLSRDSSFVARALAKDHWPTLVVGQAIEPQEIRLFANKLIGALIDLSLNGTDRKEAYKQGVVLGRLTQNGQTIAGARVEMADGYQAIYFDDMYLPSANMTGTSKNGLFAFVKVRAGVQALRVRAGGYSYPAQIFPTEDKHVSYVELDLRDKATSQFKVFDGLDMKKPVSARLRLVGNDDVLTVGRDDFVEYSVAANPFMVEADGGGEYEVSRVTVTGTPHAVHIPLIHREWLNQLQAQKSIPSLPGRGIILGLMDDQDFEVELTGYAPGESMQIVYFDVRGNALESKTGVAGGGFVIFNAPTGLQTLYVHPTQSRETFSQVVVAEPEFLQVVTH